MCVEHGASDGRPDLERREKEKNPTVLRSLTRCRRSFQRWPIYAKDIRPHKIQRTSLEWGDAGTALLQLGSLGMARKAAPGRRTPGRFAESVGLKSEKAVHDCSWTASVNCSDWPELTVCLPEGRPMQ